MNFTQEERNRMTELGMSFRRGMSFREFQNRVMERFGCVDDLVLETFQELEES